MGVRLGAFICIVSRCKVRGAGDTQCELNLGPEVYFVGNDKDIYQNWP